MKKLYREVVVLPDKEHKVLLKKAKELKVPKSRVFRMALVFFDTYLKQIKTTS